jgi:hypothetical protein
MDNRNEIEKFVVLLQMQCSREEKILVRSMMQCNSHTHTVLSPFYLYLIYLLHIVDMTTKSLFYVFSISTRPKSNSALSSIHLGIKLDPRER